MWISFGSVHEVRAFRERKRRSLWFRKLVESCVVYGDRGYRGCEGVIVCGRSIEDILSQLKALGFTALRLPVGLLPTTQAYGGHSEILQSHGK